MLSGTLDLYSYSEIDPPAALAAAVAQWWRADADLDTVVAALRAATVLVEVDTTSGAHELVCTRLDGLAWVPVFTSLPELAVWMQQLGRGAETITHGQLTGAELLDDALPQLPQPAGLVLDPACEHVMALPPVAPIVSPEMACTAQES